MAEPDLIRVVREGLPDGVELDERETALLELAARQLADVERAEQDIERRGYTVTGSKGQETVNPSVSEARQGRLVVARLLGMLDLPESTKARRS
jgi:hypothetical protein